MPVVVSIDHVDGGRQQSCPGGEYYTIRRKVRFGTSRNRRGFAVRIALPRLSMFSTFTQHPQTSSAGGDCYTPNTWSKILRDMEIGVLRGSKILLPSYIGFFSGRSNL